MKLSHVISSGLAAIALSAISAHAQTISSPGAAGYSSGDLLLSFYGTSALNDTVFDIGTLASYEGLAAGTYTVAGFDSASDVTSNTGAFGSSVYWNVAGGNIGTGELTVTTTTTPTIHNSSTYNILAGTIDNIGYEVSGSAGSGTSNNDAILADKPIFNQISFASHTWNGGPTPVTDSVTTGTTKLYLYDIDHNGVSSGNAVDLGYFTLNTTTDALTFTVTAIPEPSTYAAILGALTVGFVMLRRRFGATGLNAAV